MYRKSNGLLRRCLCLLLDHWVFFSGKAGSETYFCSDIGQLFAAVRTASFSHWLVGGSFPSSLLIVFLFFYRYQKVSLHIKNILFTSLIYWVALSDWRVADDPAFCSYTRHNFPWAVSKPLLLFIPQPPPPIDPVYTLWVKPLNDFLLLGPEFKILKPFIQRKLIVWKFQREHLSKKELSLSTLGRYIYI